MDADHARESARRADGRFGEQHRAEDDGVDLLAETRARAGALETDLAAHRALVLRLETFEALKDLPDDHAVSTVAWPEEPYGNGTFDVDLNVVYDANGDEVDDIGGQGAVPAGWYTTGDDVPWRTAYDVWREDPANPESDIEIAKMKAWHQHLMVDRLLAVEPYGKSWRGSGFGNYSPVKVIGSLDEVHEGDLLAEQSAPFGARNLLRVTGVDHDRGLFTGHFVDPTDPTRKRLADDITRSIWDHDLHTPTHTYFKTAEPASSSTNPLSDPGTITPETPYGTTRITRPETREERDARLAREYHQRNPNGPSEHDLNEGYGV